ncbi:MAG: hypothetical protein AUK44_09655 [Porphyromonadaceae bacterium CG2_30_38_12]|nr:MAG: hypothetical protein AUK44_09655 [Porphyromonadaceae bacterium CG2_30_38_12]
MKSTNIIKIWVFLLGVIVTQNTNAQNYTFKSVNLQGMGYITGLVAHPTSGDMYARTDTYGIYKWDRTNQMWQPLMDGKVSTGSVESIAIDPSNENNVYTVNGNGEYGVFCKSTDKGATWTEINAFKSKAILVYGNGIFRGAGERLAVDPNNGGKVIFFASRIKGLWKSADAGASWTQIPSTNLPFGTPITTGGIVFVSFDRNSGNATTNSQVIYAGVQSKGVYKSVDGGTNWTLLSGGPATNLFPIRSSIANDGTVYFTYASTDNDGGSGAVYKYTGSGNLIDVTPANKISEGFWGVAVDPLNSNKVATYQWRPGNGNGIHYSSNGGASWTSMGFSAASRVEPSWYPSWSGYTYSAAMIMDPLDTKNVWLTTGFAAYNTPDISNAASIWTAKMNNFEELVVNIVSCPPAVEADAADLIAGFADKQGFRIQNRDIMPTKTVEPEAFGIMTGIAYCEADPNFIVTVGGSQNGGTNSESGAPKYRYSTDNGKTWTNFTAPTTTSVNGNIAVSATDKNRWVIAPKNRQGTFNQPYFTTDGGKTWTMVSGLPVNVANDCTEQWSASEFLVADKVNGMTFYYYTHQQVAGTSTSGFYKSTDGGATFTLVSSALPSNFKTKVVAVPGKEGHLFTCPKSGGNLSFSSDGGTTWTSNTAAGYCRSVGFGKAIAPSVEPTIFIYSTIGSGASAIKSLYQSTDYGATWTNISNGLIPTNISNITGDMRTAGLVYLATGGRGIIYGVSNEFNGLRAVKNELKVYPNPVNDLLTIEFAENVADSSLALYNAIGQQVFAQKVPFSQQKVSINLNELKLNKGIYFVKNISETEEFLARIIKQ